MAKFIGTLISTGCVPAEDQQTIEVSTNEIEELLRSRFEKGGWEVDFDWPPGQWPRMIVSRKRVTEGG